MRIRTVITGILAAVLCLLVLRLQFFRIGLSRFVPGWPNEALASSLPGWVSAAVLIYCGIILFTFGWVAARWNWANNWQRGAQVGAQMGLLAGCLIYDFIGVLLFGIQGQQQILKSFDVTLSEAEATRIITEAVVRTGSILYGYFLLTILACVVLGSLGGLASALIDRRDFWGRHPRNPEGWLFRSTAYLLTLTGYLNMVVGIVVLNYWRPKVMNTTILFAEKFGERLDIEFQLDLFLFSSTLTLWMFAFLPAGLTCGWIIRAWIVRKRTNFLSKLWLVFSTIGLLSLTWLLFPSAFSSVVDLTGILISFCTGAGLGLFAEDQSQGFPYHVSDWLGYGVTYGILGGTQILTGILAYVLSNTFIGIINLPHLLSSGQVEQEPVQQVLRLLNVVNFYARLGIFASMAIGLLAISLVAFLRSIMGIKDFSHDRR